MKLVKNLLGTLLVLMIGVITFFTWNLIGSFVSNYQSLSPTALSGLPMIIFMIEIYVVLFGIFNYIVLQRRDAFFFRKYSLITFSFAVVGIATSIACGTYVYHTFVGDYVFSAYPLFMLIIHTLFLGISGYLAFVSIKQISQEKPVKSWKNTRFYWVREVLIAFMLMFALEKLGGVVLLPLLYSSYDGAYVIPFYIQLLVPTFIFASYMVDRHYLHNKKVNIILTSIALGYSILSLLYMLLMHKFMAPAYPTLANPLSPIMQLERLVTKPLGFIILYLFCLLYSSITLLLNIIRLVKEKKAR